MEAENEEQELTRLLATEPERAVERLFGLYYPELCRSAYRLLPDAALAEDLVQEVFYELWKRRGDLRITTSFRAYLRRATRNKALNYIRDHRRVRFEPEAEQSLPATPPEAAHGLEVSELQALIDQAVDQLPERCRIIFILSRFEDMTYQEIAGQLGISEKTVENQVSKALRLLRQALGPFLTLGMLILGCG